MDAFFNTYLPWGIIAVIMVICFCINYIDVGRSRSSNNPYAYSPRKFEFIIIICAAIGALLCLSIIPLSILWGVAIGMIAGLVLALYRRKNGK